MHGIIDSSLCPVRSFLKYKRQLNPECPYLFQRVNTTGNSSQKFTKAPIGHNKLGSMMQILSKKAGLSMLYTNHSLRATSVHVLDEAQVPSRHIMSVTGHKAETSLKTYSGYTDNNTKKRMSTTISDACEGPSVKKISTGVKKIPTLDKENKPSTSTISQDDISDMMMNDDDFDEFLRSFDCNNNYVPPVQQPVQLSVPAVRERPIHQPLHQLVPTVINTPMTHNTSVSHP